MNFAWYIKTVCLATAVSMVLFLLSSNTISYKHSYGYGDLATITSITTAVNHQGVRINNNNHNHVAAYTIGSGSGITTKVPTNNSTTNFKAQDVLFTSLYRKIKDSVVSILSVFRPSQSSSSTTTNTTNTSTSAAINSNNNKTCQLSFILDIFKIKAINASKSLEACEGHISEIPTIYGSGFVYDNLGHIITNQHVIQGSTSADITFDDGNSYTAKIVGQDQESDLAVLQVNPPILIKEYAKPLPILSNSSRLLIGQNVIAVGNPLGLFSGSMTQGIISQTNRVLLGQKENVYLDLIQHDAPITQGNSGGPLLNLDGQVIGVSSAVAPNSTFINFAIPSSTLQRIVPHLIASGNYTHPWLGIGIFNVDVTPFIARLLSLKESTGFLVTSVDPSSPAALAGIKNATGTNYDVVVGVDNTSVRKKADLLNYIETKSVGDQLVLHLLRNGKTPENLKIVLAARPLKYDKIL